MAEIKLELSMLCDVYGALLSERQKDAVEMYCNEDYSLSEIAEHMGISRQGVRDQIKHAQTQLDLYESKLGLFEKTKQISEKLTQLSEKDIIRDNPEILAIIQDIQEKLNF